MREVQRVQRGIEKSRLPATQWLRYLEPGEPALGMYPEVCRRAALPIVREDRPHRPIGASPFERWVSERTRPEMGAHTQPFQIRDSGRLIHT